jgi:hypothetical protein
VRDIEVLQINLICAHQLMSAKRPAAEQNGGYARAPKSNRQ